MLAPVAFMTTSITFFSVFFRRSLDLTHDTMTNDCDNEERQHEAHEYPVDNKSWGVLNITHGIAHRFKYYSEATLR